MRSVPFIQQVKFPRKTTVVLGIFVIVVGAVLEFDRKFSFEQATVKYYTEKVQLLKEDVGSLLQLAKNNGSLQLLKQQFKKARCNYKKLSILTDYFDPVAARYLNRPALAALEPGTTDKLMPPSGFQFMEEKIFGEWREENREEIFVMATGMSAVLDNLLAAAPGKSAEFREELVWEAIRMAIVQVMTTGIAGFDSPIAGSSLSESAAVFEGVKELLYNYKERLKNDDLAALQKLARKNAHQLARAKNFNSFDRLKFLRTYADPFYRKMVSARRNAGIGVPEGTSPINYNANSIFDEDYFNIDFYGPPADYHVTTERVALGKLLFNDPVLSGERNRNCASCHQPEKGFSDGLPKPFALDNKTLLPRNTPTLWNAGFQTKQFWDSRADILENQLSEVVHNLQEMQGSLANSVDDLKSIPEYADLFKKAYPADRNPITRFTLANAISSYIRSLRSNQSRFDQYLRGESGALDVAEKKGFAIFMGKGKCGTCHFIPLFNGVIPPVFQETESEVLGVPATKEKNGARLDPDLGKYNTTHADIHRFAFKTPGLRNIALTAPYMHNGVFSTLEEVVDFYNEGGGAGLGIAPPNQTLPPDKLNLTAVEKANLVKFMKALTDTNSGKPVNK